jgi:exonuclease III
VRIVTWNLNNGRAADAWPRLQAALGAELVLLQETPPPDWCSARLWESVPHHGRGSAVLCTTGVLRAVRVPGYEGWVVGGELVDSDLSVDGRPLFVFSVHTPSPNATQRRRQYVAETMSILNLLGEHVPDGANLVLGGDFNFRSLGERQPDEQFQTIPSERRVLARFSDLGLISCWAAAHPGCPLPQTLRWTRDRTPDRSTPYHCDGIFVPAAWAPGIVCEVLTSAVVNVSDHNPVAAWISR